mgnify:CR=1 FL=1
MSSLSANREILLSASNGSRKSGGRNPEFICDGFHQGYGSSVCSGRSCNLPCRSRFYFRILPFAQAGYPGTFAQRSRRPPDQKRTGIGKQASGHLCKKTVKRKPFIGCSPVTVKDEQKLKELSENIARLALPDSAKIIAQEVIKLAEKRIIKKSNEYRNDKISLFRRCRRHRNECTCTLLPFQRQS